MLLFLFEQHFGSMYAGFSEHEPPFTSEKENIGGVMEWQQGQPGYCVHAVIVVSSLPDQEESIIVRIWPRPAGRRHSSHSGPAQ